LIGVAEKNKGEKGSGGLWRVTCQFGADYVGGLNSNRLVQTGVHQERKELKTRKQRTCGEKKR